MSTRPCIVDDGLWTLIEPLLLPERPPGPRPVPGRPRRQGIPHVLHRDITRQLLPPEMGFGSGPACRRRLER
ncbi:hypothetical protein [Streptomyces europaeiscabiei]|uniref:hypothetical protein n=1 Tax=Streptomyces europaeiscabiei TaxID=146819 RepID=UPI000B080720|nr:hypothetical protein [Streptomyces europaeiscabiei]MDX2758149.1 hypothetical protein [Streptomyces europaeiscabiei]